MHKTFDSTLLTALTLNNPEPNDAARVGIVSLPIPLGAEPPAGIDGFPTHGNDIAWWPPSRCGGGRIPRRRMMYTVSDKAFQTSLRLGNPGSLPANAAQPTLSVLDIHKDYKSLLPIHTGELVLTRGDVQLGIRMGLRWRDELHWWEWVRIDKLWSSPVVSAWQIGGVIAVVPTKAEDVFPDRTNIRKSEWLHRQNWVRGDVYLLSFANGVVQCYCRHVNNHAFDEGREQHDVTSIIAFSQKDAGTIDRKWTGTDPMIQLGKAKLNLTDCSTLVSEEHPGSLRSEDGLVLFQPYEGFEIGGDSAKLTGMDGLFFRASQRIMPRGVARTVRFTLGLGDAAPIITRFTVPDWWCAVSGDLWSDGVLPVRDSWDSRIEATYQDAVIRKDKPGRFDDYAASVGREGEVPFVQFMYAHRTGDPAHWRRALRDAYHMADIAFDHATETIRMHNYPFDGTISPALFRIMGMLYGYLETGDPYLRECSEAASMNFLAIDRANWPRNSYGRDAMSVRGLVFLADYLGSEQYREWAREAIGRVMQCQLPDGSYNDQGGGVGVHAIGQLPIKPWMANMATNPMLDYVERWPDDPQIWESILKYGDFLVRAGTQEDGSVRWPYQFSYGGTNFDPWREIFNAGTGMANLPDKSVNISSYKARSLCIITRHTGNPVYFDAWLKFFDKYWRDQLPDDRRWSVIKSLWHLPYAQAHAWNARWRDDRVEIAPLPSSYRTELKGTISTPRGSVKVKIRRPDPKQTDRWEIVEQSGPKGVEVVLKERTR